MKKVYLLPNLITTASLFCGMLAITQIFQDRLVEAAWLILAAAILDAFDGKIARLTRTESAFGVNYDSLADLVSFGVAPALLMFSVIEDAGSVKIASGVTTLYAICGALRLARFNVQRTREEKRTFTGLPIPAAAAMVISAFLVYHRLDPVSDMPAKMMPFLLVILSYLMVSKIPYPSHKNLDLERRKSFDYLVSIILAVCIVLALLPYTPYMLFAVFGGYVVFGVARAGVKGYQRRRWAILHPGARPEDKPQEPVPLER